MIKYKISSLFFDSFYKCQNWYAMFWKFWGGGECPSLVARLWCTNPASCKSPAC